MDIFDVFEEAPQSDSDSDVEVTSPVASPVVDSRKRKSKTTPESSDEEAARADPDADADEDEDTDIPNAHSDKRRKTDVEAEPVLTDTFETAASREVAAAATLVPAETEGDASLVLSHNIQHQVALPPDLDYEYIPLSEHKPPAEPARTYPFPLDPFQSLSVASIEREESVLVSAHTSAGKTVVAEYAVAQCLKRNQRVIYTSPIKALSNQKYRDFEAIFGDVGLMTGDVTINPTASCLVMTTEILRSMLYRGSEIMREVAWVVFDEVHYLREKTRGVVWEETIILLPDKVRYVFLSATIPNAFQFAEWIAKIHHQACHVVYTDFRPTPLQNFFFPAGGDGIFLVVDEKRVFKEDNFNKVMRQIEEKTKKDQGENTVGRGKNKRAGKGGSAAAADANSDISKIIKMIIKRNMDPVIVFSFSKRECENLALQISHFCFNNESERKMVRQVFQSAVESLAEADRELPQIANILPLLERGIGVHHSGLLPILKETIEILFQESLIKVLFATETFSIGLNMPAKTVVFTQVTKWDGVKSRPLTPSEYVQMSGRAGRRGLDSRGVVIMMVDASMKPEVAKEIVVGQQDRLNSAFYLGYNMILNLLRIEAISPEYMLERCFFHFQNTASVPALERELMDAQRERAALVIPDEAAIKEYYHLRSQLALYKADLRFVLQRPEYCTRFLHPGRVVRIFNPLASSSSATTLDDDDADYGWGVVVRLTRRQAPSQARVFNRPVRGATTTNGQDEEASPPQESYVIDVMMYVGADSDFTTAPKLPHRDVPFPPDVVRADSGHGDGDVSANHDRFERVTCLLTCVKSISQIQLKINERDELPDPKTLKKQVTKLMSKFPDGLPLLDPLEHYQIQDESFQKLLRKMEVLESKLLANPLHHSALLPAVWAQYARKVALAERVKQGKKDIARAHSVSQMDELKARKRVLRRLGFINEAEVVQLKARVACEISSTEGHELLLAELLFDRFFNEMTPELCAAVLSIFIFDEKVETQPLKPLLDAPYREVVAKARIVAKVSRESKLDVEEEEYVGRLKWQLMETVYEWARGKSFAEICKMTDAYEGSLIRHFRRLEELMRQMAEAGKVMGSDELTQKFEASLLKIRRDIMAAQSLYL